MKLLVSEYQEDGWGGQTRVVSHPTWDDLQFAVLALDRFRRPFIWLYLDERAEEGRLPDFEVIGGAGAYAMQGLEGGQQRRYRETGRGEESIPIWTSDQGADIPAEYVCADIDRVLRAARYYYENGRLDPGFTWALA